MSFQTTIAKSVALKGVGLHSGEAARAVLKPAPARSGIIFRRTDLPAETGDILARREAVSETRLATVIANDSGARVGTVEHLLAALAGMGVDNVVVEVDAEELPAMDGSAAPFARAIVEAGLVEQAAPRPVMRILRPVHVDLGDRRAAFLPCERFEIDVTIDFEDPAIGRQRARMAPSRSRFLADIAPARTFAFLKDVEAMKAAGYARGGSFDNAVVLDEGRVLNPDGLRFPDEFVRHKVVDVLGDLAIAGAPIMGRYVATRPGHALNQAALDALAAARDAWRIETPAIEPAHVEESLAAAAAV